MKIDPKFKVLKIAGENIIISQGANSSEMTSIISLNSTALELWNEFSDREFTEADVSSYLKEAHGIGEELASVDAISWIESLRGSHVICQSR